MHKKMTWNEIKKQYPDEWVLLTEYVADGIQFTEGVVVGHSQSRCELVEACKSVNPFALVFTGEITRGVLGVHVEALDTAG